MCSFHIVQFRLDQLLRTALLLRFGGLILRSMHKAIQEQMPKFRVGSCCQVSEEDYEILSA